MRAPAATSRTSWVDYVLVVLVIGYLTMGRRFAYIGFSPIFIGEVGLGSILLARYGAMAGTWFTALSRPSAIGAVAWMIFFGALYGTIAAFRGLSSGYDLMVILKLLVVHTYPLFFFAGAWVGQRNPELLNRLIHWLAWAVGIYGVLYVFVLQPANLGAVSASAEVPIAGQPYGPAVSLLGLLCFTPNLRKAWLPLLLNAITLLGLQVRASWLGFAAAISLWAFLKGQVTRVAALGAVVGVVLLVGVVTDVTIPSPGRRGGELSAKGIVAQSVAPLSASMAEQVDPDRDKEVYSGTVNFRFTFWSSIWENIHSNQMWTLFGPGYGFPIWELGPEDMPQGAPQLRSPHSIFMYCLAYTGWVGVGLFYALQFSIGAVLWKVYRQTGQAFGLCYVVMINAWALFDPLIGSPMGAIPYYCLVGLAAAPALLQQTQSTPRNSQ